MGRLNNKIILINAVRAITGFIAIALFCYAQSSFSSFPVRAQRTPQVSFNHVRSPASKVALSPSRIGQSESKSKKKSNTGKTIKSRLLRAVANYLNAAHKALWGQHGWNTHYLRRLVTLGSAVLGASMVKDAIAAQTHNNQQQLQPELPPSPMPVLLLGPELPVLPDPVLLPDLELPVQPHNKPDSSNNQLKNVDIKEQRAESEGDRIVQVEREQKERFDRVDALFEARKQRGLERDSEQKRLNAELDAKLLEQQQDAQQKDVERQARRAHLKAERESLPMRFMEAVLRNSQDSLQEAVRLITDDTKVEIQQWYDHSQVAWANMRHQNVDQCKSIVNKDFVNALKSTIQHRPWYVKRRTWLGAELPLTTDDALKYINSEMSYILRWRIPIIEKNLSESIFGFDSANASYFVPVNLFRIAIKLNNLAMVDVLLKNYSAKIRPLNQELAGLIIKHDCIGIMERVYGNCESSCFNQQAINDAVDNNSLQLVARLIDHRHHPEVWYHAVHTNNQEAMSLILDKMLPDVHFNQTSICNSIFKSNNLHAMKILLDKAREHNQQPNSANKCSVLDEYLYQRRRDIFMMKLIANEGVQLTDSRNHFGKDSIDYFIYHDMGSRQKADIVRVLFADQKQAITPKRMLSLLLWPHLYGEIQDFIFDGTLDKVSRDDFEDIFDECMPSEVRSFIFDAKRRDREVRRVLLEENTKGSADGEKRKHMPNGVIDIIEGYCYRPQISDELYEVVPSLPVKARDIVEEYVG